MGFYFHAMKIIWSCPSSQPKSSVGCQTQHPSACTSCRTCNRHSLGSTNWWKLGNVSSRVNFCPWPNVRATPKSNSVDNVRALQGNATAFKYTIKLWWDGVIIERRLTKAFPHTIDGGNPKRTQLGCLLVMYSVYILCYRYCTLFEYY